MNHGSAQEVETRLRALPATITLRNEDTRALASLEIVAQAPRSSANAAAGPRGRRRWTAAAGIAAVMIVVVEANLLAAYFAPTYGRALADTPGIGPISERFLGAVGLSGGDVTVVGDSATSSGHTLRLEGVYADGLRTVMFVSIDGKGLSGNPKAYGPNPGDWGISYDGMTVTDQFARSYEGWGVGGPTVLQLKPLEWPASAVGARLTLHVTGLWAMWKVIERGPGTASDQEQYILHGDWYLHTTVVGGSANKIPLPPTVRTASAVYTFTSIVASRKTLVVHWTIAGPVNAEAESNRPIGPNLPSETYRRLLQDYFSPRLYDEAGTQVQMQDYGTEWPKGGGAAKAEMTAFIKGPGHYRIQFGAALTAPDQQRWIVVP